MFNTRKACRIKNVRNRYYFSKDLIMKRTNINWFLYSLELFRGITRPTYIVRKGLIRYLKSKRSIQNLSSKSFFVASAGSVIEFTEYWVPHSFKDREQFHLPVDAKDQFGHSKPNSPFKLKLWQICLIYFQISAV